MEISHIVQIERECQRLCIEYVRRMDERDDRCADLFTAEARLVLFADDLRGSAEIRGFIGRLPTEVSTLHLCSNIAVDVINDWEARGVSDMIYFKGRLIDGVSRRAALSPLAIGTYEDTYQRTAAGWRIATRRFSAKFLAVTVNPPATR